MKITLEAGVSQTLSLVGYNFMFKNGSGDIRVKIMNNNSTVIEESDLEVGEQLVNGSERWSLEVCSVCLKLKVSKVT